MKHVVFLALFMTFVAATGFSQADLQTVATINLSKTESITVRMLRTEVDRMEKAAGQTLSQQQRREILDAMINERLAIQAAERDKITISENEVNQQINQLKDPIAQNIGRMPTDTEFATAIKNETGLDMPAFREQMRRQMVIQKYLMTKKQGTFDSIKVPSESEIVNAYNLTKSHFVRPDTIRFSIIQVPFGENAASKTKAKELADRLVREIGSSPSKFDEVSIRGQAANSGYQAGDGGYLPRNMEAAQIVGQEFITSAFNLKQSEVSKVIEGQRGYQIIKVTETYAMKSLELDDIFQLGTRMTVRDYIGNVMLQERQMEVLAQAQKELVDELRAGRTFQVFERNLNW